MKPRRIDFYMADWFEGTIAMTCCERGLYITALMAIYANGGPISVLDLRARCQREHGKSFNHLLGRLLDLGKLIKTEDGNLDNQRCEKELKAASIRFQKASENGTRGNEIKKLANATRSLSPSPSPSPEERKNPPVPESSEPIAARDHLRMVHDADRDRPAEDTPAATLPPRSARNRDGVEYKFGGRFIRLNAADFDRWEKTFSAIPDFTAYLEGLDSGYFVENVSKRKGWFTAVPAMAAKRNQDILVARRQEEQDRKEGEKQPFMIGIG